MPAGEPVDLACTRCALSQGRTHVVPGKGPPRSALVLLGEAPGAEEDERGEPFVGRAGKTLDGALAEAGVSRAELFITNVVKCRPPGNRKPTPEEQEACRPFLVWELQHCGAAVALALGATAAGALTGRKVEVTKAGEASEQVVVGGAKLEVFATIHPAASRFRKGARGEIAKAVRAAAERAGLERKAPRRQARL